MGAINLWSDALITGPVLCTVRICLSDLPMQEWSNLLRRITPTQLLLSKDKVGERSTRQTESFALQSISVNRVNLAWRTTSCVSLCRWQWAIRPLHCIKPKQDVTSHSLSHTCTSSQGMMDTHTQCSQKAQKATERSDFMLPVYIVWPDVLSHWV